MTIDVSVVCITPNEPDGKLPNGLVVNGVAITPPVTNGVAATPKNNHRKSMDKGPERDRNDSESRKTAHAHTNGSVRAEEKKVASNGAAVRPAERPDERKSPVSAVNGSVLRPDERKTSANGAATRLQDKTNGSPHLDLEYNERVQ